jgi:beta-galactosidase GanA
VGVVSSSWSKIIYEQTSSSKVSPAHYMGQMLLDMLVPFEYIITESDITDVNELLANYKAIILPHFPSMTDAQINVHHDYLHNGGAVYATYNKGKYDDDRVTRSPQGLD